MSTMVFHVTSLMVVFSTVYSGTDKKKTSKFHVAGLCEGNSPMTGEFPAQRVSNAENVSIWWRHHAHLLQQYLFFIIMVITEICLPSNGGRSKILLAPVLIVDHWNPSQMAGWFSELMTWWHQAITWTDSRFAPRQWETALLCNDVSHWRGANLESALHYQIWCWLIIIIIPRNIPQCVYVILLLLSNKVSRLHPCKRKVPEYYVKNKALFETWK